MVKSLLVRDYFSEYTYVVVDSETGSGWIIDPGAEADKILRIVDQNGWSIEKILLTHGHFDHTGAVNELRDCLHIPVYASSVADTYLLNPKLNLSRDLVGDRVVRNVHTIDTPVISLREGTLSCKVIKTPGHTPDSVSYYVPEEKAVFVGDLFYMHGAGLTNFAGGSPEELAKSIANLLSMLPDDTIVYSGHSAPLSVGEQRQLFKKMSL